MSLPGVTRLNPHELVSGHAPERPEPWDMGWVRYEVEGDEIRRVELP